MLAFWRVFRSPEPDSCDLLELVAANAREQVLRAEAIIGPDTPDWAVTKHLAFVQPGLLPAPDRAPRRYSKVFMERVVAACQPFWDMLPIWPPPKEVLEMADPAGSQPTLPVQDFQAFASHMHATQQQRLSALQLHLQQRAAAAAAAASNVADGHQLSESPFSGVRIGPALYLFKG